MNAVYDDDDDIEYLDREQRPFDEKLERVGGVFAEPQHGEVDCNTEDSACAPDDYPEDPYAVDNRPGTVDDVGYSYGLMSPDASDLSLVPEGSTHFAGKPAPSAERDLEPGTEDEADLWDRIEPLVEEDVEDGLRIPLGMDDQDGRHIMGAMGDDEGDEIEEDAAMTSATGEPSTGTDHGGFPEHAEGE